VISSHTDCFTPREGTHSTQNKEAGCAPEPVETCWRRNQSFATYQKWVIQPTTQSICRLLSQLLKFLQFHNISRGHICSRTLLTPYNKRWMDTNKTHIL